MLKKIILLMILIILSTTNILAAEPETKIIRVPIIARSPETGVILGGMAIYLKEEEEKNLKVDLAAMYTQENQANIFLKSYKGYDDKKLELGISYQDWISKFYGIGNNTDIDNEEKYNSKGFKVEGSISKEIINDGFLGLITSYEDYSLSLNKEIEGIEESKGIDLLSLGLKYSYDTRDRRMNTRSGQYLNYEAKTYYYSMDDYKFFKHDIDYRFFKSISNEHTIGFQTKLEINRGEIPFQSLASLGNSNIMRGVINGRYIDNNKFAAQIEYRYPIHKKFSGVVFASIGEVYEKDFKTDQLKESYGLGVRYNLDKESGINMRLDLAFGQEESQFYVNIGESF
ncbi:BamA/TamA family outer membrane protein [Orenia marismortui]|uniref:Surface antigen-like protein n=1 Tax=Orenia marismortui TaxID=46469 RepID=A0A4R8GDW1_9FIRM|nr:BamA/TamA family outer membrane protein [Orenia marismortui]TDX43686.1 surface antigen-like protein [Orenia marismortui]